MKTGSLCNQTSPKHWTHHGPAPPAARLSQESSWSALIKSGFPFWKQPSTYKQSLLSFFILKNYFQAIKRISIKQWQWIEQVVFYSRKYSLLMLVYGINSKTGKEGEKWKSKETINHFKKQAAVFEIIRLEFVSDVSFCEGVSAAAASRCWWELNHTDQEEWHWHLTYGQRFRTTNPISKESLMNLICNLLDVLKLQHRAVKLELLRHVCWANSADPNILVQHCVCAAACRYMHFRHTPR